MIVAGALQLLLRDFVWSWTQWSNSFRGLATKRTLEWEFASKMQGIGWIVAGIVIVLFAGFVTQPRGQHSVESTDLYTGQPYPANSPDLPPNH